MKYTILALLLTTLPSYASPRTEYLAQKLQEASRIELQSKSKYELTKARYHSAEAYRKSIAKELKQVRRREEREYKASMKAKEAEYSRVDSYLVGDMSAPTNIKWKY